MLQNCFINTSLLLNISLQNPFIKVLLPLLGIAVIVLLCKYRFHYSLVGDLQLRKPLVSQTFLWLAIAIAWMLLTDYFINWRGPWDFTAWKAQPIHVSILRILAVCFLGPITEELVFRGVWFRRLIIKNVNPWIAIIILAALWAALHYTYSIPVILIIFIEGILLGLALIKSKSVVVPILMHICWNLYAVW